MTRAFKRLARFALLTIACCVVSHAAQAAAPPSDEGGVWRAIGPTDLESRKAVGSRPGVRPDIYRAFELDSLRLEAILNRTTTAAGPDGPRLSLPMPDGGFESFVLMRTHTMAPELERQMADLGWPMRTYRGVSLDRPGVVAHLDWGGPEGFHALVAAPAAVYFIDPYWRGDLKLYVSYAKGHLRPSGKRLACAVAGSDPVPSDRRSLGRLTTTGGDLRTYRLAMAATGEYTAAHGGTPVGGQAGIATTVDRVNLVYELETSIQLMLVGGNLGLVYTDPVTDPYTNSDGETMLDENQANVDAVIGTANYDIGHVVSTGGGGVAGLGVVCGAPSKARGVTGSASPVGDPFDIDFVAHEIGHQFGGRHSWNAVSGCCSPANWSSTTAYEVGSGSTIMGYAGICGPDDFQPHSDDNFHSVNLDEILAFAAGAGACSSNSAAGNANPPTVDAGAAFTIPVGTPFELEAASGGDADGDHVTYAWEEFDLGTQASLATGDDGVQPIFRAWPPVDGRSRTFPRLDELLQNTAPRGETLPTTARTLTFRVTARDNHAGGGRVASDTTTVTTAGNSGPFRVLSPNGGEHVTGMQMVTWDVANTTAAPVSAATVDILLSVDGGRSFPITLKSATPNDGSEAVDFTGRDTATARLKIRGSGSVFFDLSNADFTVGDPQPHLLILLDRTGSMQTIRPSTGNTRCRDALELAKQDVRSFFSKFASIPGISASVWTFAGTAPTNLTGGFVNEAAALSALGGLSPDGCTDSTPLADAICSASDAMMSTFPSVGPGDRILAISSDGGENVSSGPCSGPESVSGPPYDPGSWQSKVRAHLIGQNVVLSRFWGSVVRSAVDVETGRRTVSRAVSDFDFFRDLATATGGFYVGVGDDEPLPPPVFGGPAPGGPPVTDVPTLSAAGLALAVAALLAAATFTLRRRRQGAGR